MRFEDLKIGCAYSVRRPDHWVPLGKVKLLGVEKVGEDALGRPRRKCVAEVVDSLEHWRGAGEVLTLPLADLSVWSDNDEIRLALTNAIKEQGRASVTLEQHQWEYLRGQLDCQDGYSW